MAFKVTLLCVSALLVQSIAGQCCGSSSGSGKYGSSGCVSISNSGGDLQVTSVGPISPSGISVSSNLNLSGDLDVNGELPYLTAVEFQTTLDSSGSSCVDYSCGSCGNVGINSICGGSSGGRGCSCRS